MAHLASVGSHRINGVAALHTELLKADVLRDFHELWPEKFVNVTNGVTPRRFLALANPRPRRARHRGDRRRLAERPRAAAAPRAARGGRRLPGEVARGEARQQGGPRGGGRGPGRGRLRPGQPLRRPGEADPRVQAPAPERPARHRALAEAAAGAAGGGAAADGPLRRQGRPRLPDGEAHDQARPLRGRGGQRRPRDPRPPARGLRPRLQRQELHADLPGGGALASRSRPRARRPPAPAT